MEMVQNIHALKEKRIYVYGAGLVAEVFAMEIGKETDIVIEAFVVSSKEQNRAMVNGVPVISVYQADSAVPVVIATLSDAHQVICKTLEACGVENIYVVSEALFRDLRKKYVLEKDEKASKKLRLNEMRKLSYDRKLEGLIISDEKLELVFQADTKNEMVSSKKFLSGQYSIKSPEVIFLLLLDWSQDWKAVLKKIFLIGREVILSFRYKYMEYDGFSLLDMVKKSGFQLSDSKRFYRDKREFPTEDVLLKFEKRIPGSLCRDKLCNGCGKCMLECPTDAIAMQADDFGYFKPRCDKTKCIACGKCVRECPVYTIKSDDAAEPVGCYAYMAEDEMRKKSSSGGVFGVIATEFLERGGYVCGAAWDRDFSVSHKLIHKAEDLPQLQMSKYVRSGITGVLPDMKEHLKKKAEILFVGCPCQVAAVKGYLDGLTENLYTIDLLCAETPSHYVFSQYLKENYKIEEIQEIGFREKSSGWRADSLSIRDKNGGKKIMHMEDLSQKAFHNRMMMPICCEHCNFTAISREGDLSIGDAWGVPRHDGAWDDGKGTSTVLVNSKKGERLYQVIEKKAKKAAAIPFSWTTGNNTSSHVNPHFNRDRFYRELKEFGFNKAVRDVYDSMYDIGLVSNWSYPNYGTELTNYALYHVLKSLGYSVLMIEWAEDSEWKPYGVTQLFEEEPYEYSEIASPARNHSDFEKYNRQCRMFVQGSDQLLNPYLYQVFGENVILDWVDPAKKKIGYGLSFGHSHVQYEENIRRKIVFHLSHFDAVSVREADAVDYMKRELSVTAQHVLDPVFLCGQDVYHKLAQKYIMEREAQLFAYILDPDEETAQTLRGIAQKKGMRLFLVSDASKKVSLQEECLPDFLYDIPVEKWMGNLISSQYVVADSFHGICFAIIFKKEFAAVCNERRGAARFLSVLRQLGLEHRLVSKIDDINDNPALQQKIDYDRVYEILDGKKEESLHWLKENLEKPHISKFSQEYCAMLENYKALERKFYYLAEKCANVLGR